MIFNATLSIDHVYLEHPEVMPEHQLDDAKLVSGIQKAAFICVHRHQSRSKYPHHVRSAHFINRNIIHNSVTQCVLLSTEGLYDDIAHTFLDVLLVSSVSLCLQPATAPQEIVSVFSSLLHLVSL